MNQNNSIMKKPAASPFRVTPATTRDIEAIAGIDARAFAWAKAQYPHRQIKLDSRDAKWFYRYGARAMAKITVARSRHAREIMGYMVTIAIPCGVDFRLRIVRIAVLPSCHRIGVGRAMVAHEMIDALYDDEISFRSIYVDVDGGLVYAAKFFSGVGLPAIGHSPIDDRRIRFQRAIVNDVPGI